MGAHTGRCFRATRRTRQRKIRQGEQWDYPIRRKAPLALRPFLTLTARGQRYAAPQLIQQAIGRYTAFMTALKKKRAERERGHFSTV